MDSSPTADTLLQSVMLSCQQSTATRYYGAWFHMQPPGQVRTHKLNNLSKDSDQSGHGKVETMNTIENIIISAVNEYEGAYDVKDLDEATDVLSYEEITELCLFYITKNYPPMMAYDLFMNCMKKFYNVTEKTIDEILN